VPGEPAVRLAISRRSRGRNSANYGQEEFPDAQEPSLFAGDENSGIECRSFVNRLG
jgi:hypothetical protein